MRIIHYLSIPLLGGPFGLAAAGLLTMMPVHLQAQAHHASGGGTYFVAPGMRSEFQFNQAHVQCKVGHGVMPDGTVMQMFMASTSVDSVSINTKAKSVTITGSMVSTVVLRFTDGTTARLTETVPYTVYAEDNSASGGGADFFSVTVLYKDTPGLDQFDLFGSPATFSGDLVTGNVVIKEYGGRERFAELLTTSRLHPNSRSVWSASGLPALPTPPGNTRSPGPLLRQELAGSRQ